MQRLEVSGAVRLIYKSIGVKGLMVLQGLKHGSFNNMVYWLLSIDTVSLLVNV